MCFVYNCNSSRLFLNKMKSSLLLVGLGCCSITSLITLGMPFTTNMVDVDVNNDIDFINDRPIVGILAQEAYSIQQYFPNHKYKSFIAASYVKYIESGGARVVPIMIGQSNQYYDNLTDNINGILFPGGATFFNESGGYGEAGTILYNYAKTKNLPVWGICLGMELIAFAEANSVDHRINCKALKEALPLLFKPDFRKSKTFGSASDDIISILQHENVTYNYHKYCITEEILDEIFTADDWHVLSLNHDHENNITYVSSFESRKYPIYAIQFHPEKNVFEWIKNKNIPHTRNAIKIAQYFLEVFLNATRKNLNKFLDEKIEQESLIYNYPVTYSGILGSSYEQLYLFD